MFLHEFSYSIKFRALISNEGKYVCCKFIVTLCNNVLFWFHSKSIVCGCCTAHYNGKFQTDFSAVWKQFKRSNTSKIPKLPISRRPLLYVFLSQISYREIEPQSNTIHKTLVTRAKKKFSVNIFWVT